MNPYPPHPVPPRQHSGFELAGGILAILFGSLFAAPAVVCIVLAYIDAMSEQPSDAEQHADDLGPLAGFILGFMLSIPAAALFLAAFLLLRRRR